MGDPRRRRKKYSRPSHPWYIDRITEEKDLTKKYGLKNRKEIWKARSAVGRVREQARSLLASSGEIVEREKKQILDKLNKLGMLESRSLDDVLALNIEDFLERRLQTVVQRKGLTRTLDQARQAVVHGHVYIGSRIVNIPGYMVPKAEEDDIRLSEKFKVINVGEGASKGKEAAAEKEAAGEASSG